MKRICVVILAALLAAPVFAQGTGSREDEAARELLKLLLLSDYDAAEQLGRQLGLEDELTRKVLKLLFTGNYGAAEQLGWQFAFELLLQGIKEAQAEQSFPATHRVSENLRLRKSPSLSADTITVLQAGTNVKLLQDGAPATIDGITAPWVKVETASGITGWCFSGYLQAAVSTDALIVGSWNTNRQHDLYWRFKEDHKVMHGKKQTDGFTDGRWRLSGNTLTIQWQSLDGQVPYRETLTARLEVVTKDVLVLNHTDGTQERLTRDR